MLTIDLFVVEAGSDKTAYQNVQLACRLEEAMEHGLRYQRGMNFGLLQLYKSGVFKNYKYFLLVANDTEFEEKSFVSDIIELFEQYPKSAIITMLRNMGRSRTDTRQLA